jgi:hypothetical protein
MSYVHIDTVRQALLDQIKALREAKPEDVKGELERARGISELAQVAVNTAKVEVDYINAVRGAASSPFLEAPDERDRTPAVPSTPQSPLPAPGDPARLGGPAADHPWRGNVTRHRLQG